MASLNKLAIRGIRSFDDKDIQTIEFFSPVTVIVGHNGSGKTTIIECLKYATTGDQPPNTRGGAFIHDPKLANEKEVKAQVKLRFRAANGNVIEAVRNLSVTVKKTGAMTMKTLEGVLATKGIEGTGKRATISTKCAEMDVEIPQLLGVSKAVLENVIFCHQEDSYWPMAEASTLKKKFDDIFEATKYTKALDAIKALRKDKVAELKTEKAKLESLKLEKSHADKLKTRITELSTHLAARTLDHEALQKQLASQIAANKKFYESSTKFREIYLKVESLTATKSHYEEELNALKVSLHELAGTDDELQSRLDNFNAHVEQQKRERAKKQARIQEIKDNVENTRRLQSQKLKEHGEFVAQAKAHEVVLSEREQLIKELAAKYDMKGFEISPLDRDQVLDFLARIEETQRRLNAVSTDLQNDQRVQDADYNAKLTELRSESEGHRARRKGLQDRITTIRTQIGQKQREVNDLENATADVSTVDGEIQDLEQRMERITKAIKDAKFDEQIHEKTALKRELDVRIATLENELKALALLLQKEGVLTNQREQLQTKENQLKAALDTHGAKFKKLVGADPKPETMEREVDRAFLEREARLPKLENTAKAARTDVQEIEAALMSLRAQVKGKSEEIKRLDKQIRENMENMSDLNLPENPTSALRDAETELVGSRDDLVGKRGAGPKLQELKTRGKQKKCCPLCARNMNNQELVVFESKVDEELAKSNPEAIKIAEEDLAGWENVVKQLQVISERAMACDKLRKTEIPALEKQIKQKEADLIEAKTADEEAARKAKETSEQKEELKVLKVYAATISRTQQDVSDLKRSIAELETELLTAGMTRTHEEAQKELDPLKAEKEELERQLKVLVTEKERQTSHLAQTQNAKHALEMKRASLQAKLSEKTSLESQIKTMKEELEGAASTIKELDDKIASLGPIIEEHERKHARADEELRERIKHARAAVQELNGSLDRLDTYKRAIERYVRDRRDRRLKECAARLEELAATIAELERTREDADRELEAVTKEIHESTATQSNLRDNLRARKLVKDIAKTQEEIDQYDIEEAAKAKRLFEEKYMVEKEKETELQARVAHLGGELASDEKQLEGLQHDLKTEYKDINKRYTDQLIKVKLSDMANDDLEKYAKALDSAIMKYHSLKMEEVNDTMRYLWNKTYQGTDIDGIKIVSDSEGATGNKRSYNYRVVMTKDQVEMDMRGRCSAGQKMLASIIIRLALADSFGQNCGILALDEPTNALDTENITALASSLADIINERKHQPNFQLIIITHDEAFLNKLHQACGIDNYWRISRDSKQKSVISPGRMVEK